MSIQQGQNIDPRKTLMKKNINVMPSNLEIM